jgi:serine/threonine protein kinase
LSDVPLERLEQFDKDWTAYEAAVRKGGEPQLEDVLKGLAGPDYRVLLRHALRMEWELRQNMGQPVCLQEYLGRFGDDGLVREVFAEERTVPHVPGTSPQGWPRVPGYEVLEKLGEGGMGTVYLAWNVGLKRHEALKMVREGWRDPEAPARARSEAEALARLKDPHVVNVYQVVEHEGKPFLALEYVCGESLEDRLKAGPLPPRLAAQLVEVLALTMHTVHESGMVHRDLKPGNVLLEGEPGLPLERLQPKVTDFGLVKYLDAGAGRTQTGVIVGTPSYMAPEQARGENHAVNRRTDVYALGAILYECLTGRPPFKAATLLETLQQVRDDLPASPRALNKAVDRGLEYICLKCLEKDPTRRYASAATLAENLGGWLKGEIDPRDLPWPLSWLFRRFTRLPREREMLDYLGRNKWNLRLDAAMSLGTHVGLLALLWAGQPGQVLWLWLVLTSYAFTWALWGRAAVGRTLSPLERDVMQLWVGGDIAEVIVFGLCCPLWGPAPADEVLRCYPIWAVVRGLTFFTEGHFCWGHFYLVGVLYFVAAVLLAWAGWWSPLAYGLFNSAVFVWLSFQALGRAPAPAGGAATSG